METVLAAERVVADREMVLWRALPRPERTSLGPFVFIDHYRSTSARGIGDRPHPHAGIEVLSYLLEGGMQHRDSLGNIDSIGAGDAQHIHAGRGVLHAEKPAGARHGLQLWTNLPPALKLSAPRYRSFPAATIPEATRPGVRVRVVTGTVDGASGPVAFSTPTVFVHVRLDPGVETVLDLDETAELGAYVMSGEARVAGATLSPGALGILRGGARLQLAAASSEPADVVVLGGAPAEGAILFSGPFVMDTPERLTQAKRDFVAGRMGRLDGVPY